MIPQRNTTAIQCALLVALAYAAGGFLWILLSDRAVEALVATPRTLGIIQTYKGWFFILFTAVLLFFVVLRLQKKAAQAEWESGRITNQYHSALEALPLAAQGYDEERRVIFWNPASETLYGYSKSEALGRRLEDLIIPPEMRDQVIQAIQNWLDNGAVIPPGQLHLQRKDGSPVTVHSTHIMFEGSAGKEMFCLDIDLTEQIRTTEALQESERQLRLTIDATNDGIWDYDLSTDEFRYSARLANMLGHAWGELPTKGCFCRNNIHVDDLERFRKAFDDYLEGRTPEYSVEFRLPHKRGGWRWIYSRGRIVARDEQGRPTRIIGAHTDISELKDTQEKLRRARDQAEAASRSKSEFLANMSHELRTPLNGLMGMLQLLGLENLPPEHREYVDTALASGRSLLSIIGDVLDFSKLEAGILDLRNEPFHLRKALETVIGNFTIIAEDKGLDLRLQIDDGVPEVVVGDGGRLRQILFNLVGNALKFTEVGHVELSVDRLPSSTHGGIRLLFQVADTGIGISERHMDHIFGAFTQVDGSYARRYQGAGLGLGIVRRLTNLMGGSVAVDSEPGQGSRFFVNLRFSEAAPSIMPVHEAAIDTASGPLHLLLAEDDRVNQIMAKRMLERLGHTVDCASNGKQALELLRDRKYDCVLMDVQMPVMDGLAATRALRAAHAAGEMHWVPIIALTAHAMTGDREKFLEAGMDGYLSKPVDIQALAQALVSLVSKASRQGPARSKD